jgi:CheY-like chemotaxis protein
MDRQNPSTRTEVQKKENIAIVDDLLLPVRRVTERLLQSQDDIVESARMWAVALNMLMDSYEDRRFDIVLMDLQMPGRVSHQTISRV